MNRTVLLVGLVMFGCGGTDPLGTGGAGGGFGQGTGGGFGQGTGGGFGQGTGGGFGQSTGGGGAGGGGPAACGPQTCTGCCFNGSCQPGSTAAGCGKAGTACTACATNQICRVDQSCGVDPESSWRVQPTSAQITQSNNGSSWDGDGSAPDPRVSMSCADQATQTSTEEASNSFQPRWSTGGCTAKAKDLLRAGWSFQVSDVDLVSNDTITGRLSVRIEEQDFISGGFGLQPAGGLQSMTVSLVRQ